VPTFDEGALKDDHFEDIDLLLSLHLLDFFEESHLFNRANTQKVKRENLERP
jgi:hypothetical protein